MKTAFSLQTKLNMTDNIKQGCRLNAARLLPGHYANGVEVFCTNCSISSSITSCCFLET